MASVLNTLLGRRTKKRKTQKGKKSGAAAAKKRVVRKTKKAAAAGKPVSIDVRDPGQIKELSTLLKKHKVVLVLVYADWCGHCQTFKQDVWSKLSAMPNRKVPMAQVNADVLEKTPLPKENVDGYPTVMVVGNDGKAQNVDDSRNLSMMKTIVSADANKVLAGQEGEEDPSESTPDPVAMNELEEMANQASPPPTSVSGAIAAVNKSLTDSGVSMGTMPPSTITPPNPPSVEDDLLMSQGSPTFSFSSNTGSASTTNASGPAVGGSLFAALSEAAKGAFAPAALASVAMTRRRRSGRGRGRRSTRRRA